MTDSPRSTAQALAYARAEHDHPSQDWTNYCQRFVRSCYGMILAGVIILVSR